MPNNLANAAFLKKFLEAITASSLVSDALSESDKQTGNDFNLQLWLNTLSRLSENQKKILSRVVRNIDDILPTTTDRDCAYYNQIFGDRLISTIAGGEFGFKNKGDPINPLFPALLASEIAQSEMCSASEMHEIIFPFAYSTAFAACFLGIVVMAGLGTLGAPFGWILLLGGLALAAKTADMDQRLTPYKDQFFAYLDEHLWSNKAKSSESAP